MGLGIHQHGEVLFVVVHEATKDDDGSLENRAKRIVAFGDRRPLSAELVLEDWDEGAFLTAKQRLGNELRTEPRLLVSFWGEKAREERLGWSRARHHGAPP